VSGPRGDDLDQLLQRAQDGDVRAFELLLAGHLPRLRRFARAFASDEAEADDLAQEALVKVYRSLRLFRYQSAFTTWMYAVVRNVFLDQARSRRAKAGQREVELQEARAATLAAEETPADALEQKQERERLWRALRLVPEEFRTAVVLFDLEGNSYDEVAAIEGVPVGTIRSRLSRGRAALKRILEESDRQAPTPAARAAALGPAERRDTSAEAAGTLSETGASNAPRSKP
jgi:RNA polymerase sigma-70 factor (ECF subfamily)